MGHCGISVAPVRPVNRRASASSRFHPLLRVVRLHPRSEKSAIVYWGVYLFRVWIIAVTLLFFVMVALLQSWTSAVAPVPPSTAVAYSGVPVFGGEATGHLFKVRAKRPLS